MSRKRQLDDFFTPSSQKKKLQIVSLPPAQTTTTTTSSDAIPPEGTSKAPSDSNHPTYPFPIPHLPQSLIDELSNVPASQGKEINDQPDLDLLYFRPFIPASIERALFQFLRQSLFFYRVKYKIKRGGIETDINTPRFTTVFGVDSTSAFVSQENVNHPGATGEAGRAILVDGLDKTKRVPEERYKTCKPRPLPEPLDHLRRLTEIFTGAEYNFCLVNYYSSGSDSISYHSDDEHFLGPNPSIASFSLGAVRDFCMKHKPTPPPIVFSAGQLQSSVAESPAAMKPVKLPLNSGDMVLMRGTTQSRWLHSIPKRSGKNSEGGRINITFRKGIKPYATENYYQYNVGSGPVFKWDVSKKEMVEWKGTAASS